MTETREATISALPSRQRKAPGRAVVLPLGAAIGVVLLAAYFLQHFPATMLAFALVLLALGRLAPLVREAAGPRVANLLKGGFEFAGVALLALAAIQGALGEIARAFAALLHG